jgi:DNA-binding transcriptional regulator YhcF (GntR family)
MNRAYADQVIAEWLESGVQSRQAAARLALELATQEPGTRSASKVKIAVKLGVHQSTAQRARTLLLGAGIVYKSGSHLYVSGG